MARKVCATFSLPFNRWGCSYVRIKLPFCYLSVCCQLPLLPRGRHPRSLRRAVSNTESCSSYNQVTCACSSCSSSSITTNNSRCSNSISAHSISSTSRYTHYSDSNNFSCTYSRVVILFFLCLHILFQYQQAVQQSLQLQQQQQQQALLLQQQQQMMMQPMYQQQVAQAQAQAQYAAMVSPVIVRGQDLLSKVPG